MKIKNLFRNFLQKKGYDIVKIYHKKIENENQTFIIGKVKLILPTDHGLPSIINDFPYYAKNLVDISTIIQKKYNSLICIDIGANVGDTVAFIAQKQNNISFVCIEGDPMFYNYLEKNIANIGKTYKTQVEIINTFLDEEEHNNQNAIINEYGTARIVQGNNTLPFNTLDSLANKNKKINNAKLLKIDTDGYDLKIIRGGINYIKETKPIIFFEYDRDFLDANKDDGFPTLERLFEIGYDYMLIYDNYGLPIVSLSKDDYKIFKMLDKYIKGKKSFIKYYDICLFHRNDRDLYDEACKYYNLS